MPPEVLQLLIQIPIVGAFIWFVLEKDKRDKATQTERDVLLQKVLDMKTLAEREAMLRLIKELENIGKAFDSHDRRVSAAIARMEERTKPRPKTPPTYPDPDR